MKKYSKFIIVILIFINVLSISFMIYTKIQINNLTEVISIVAEDENLTYKNGLIIEYDNQTGKETTYTIKEFLKQRSD